MWKETVVSSCLLAVALAAVALAPLEPKPDKFKEVEGCYIQKLDAVIPFGEAAPDKEGCMEYRCGRENVQYVSCGAVGATPPCIVVSGPSKPYPGCCPTIKCPEIRL